MSHSKMPQKNEGSSNCSCTILEEFQTEVSGIIIFDSLFQQFREITETVKVQNVTCLLMAILRNDPTAVQTSLDNGCGVNLATSVESNGWGSYFLDGFTPLMVASRWFSLPVVSLLIGHPGIQTDKRNARGQTALAMAVRNTKNVDIVKLLVEHGSKMELRDYQGYCALHHAIDVGTLEVVEYLHSAGASIHTRGDGRATPLWRAIYHDNFPIARYLVQNGATLLSPRCFGNFSPFCLAVQHGNVEIVKCIIEKGGNTILRDIESNLRIAQKRMEDESDYSRKKEKYAVIISTLNAAAADFKNEEVVKTCDCSFVEEFEIREGSTFQNLSCLGIAVLQNNVEAVETSLAKGCDVNFDKTKRDDCGGWTPLMLACQHSSLPVVVLLLTQPAIQIDEADFWSNDKEEVALNRAVRRDDNLDMVKLLVEAGADPDIRSKNGISHLHEAAYSQQLDSVKYLQSKGAWINTEDDAKTTPLWVATYLGNVEMVKYLAREGASLETPSAWYGYFPLNIAVAEANVDVVKFLIEQGADVNKESQSQSCSDRKFKKDDFMKYFPTGHYYSGKKCQSQGSNWPAGKGCRDGAKRSNLEIARERMKSSATSPEKIPLYEEIICNLKEAGAKEIDNEVVNQLVLDAMDAIMWTWPEKCDESCSYYGGMPQCIKKLQVITEEHKVWLTLVQALLEVIPIEHPIGPTVIAILIKICPMPVHFDPTNVDTYLKVLEMASSFDSNDSRHRNMSIILSCIAGDVRRFRDGDVRRFEMNELLLSPAMLDYLFGNLIPDSTSQTAMFSLLTLESLAHQEKWDKNPNTEIIREHLTKLSPEDHPLLRLENLVESNYWEEKQLGFCSQWYLHNLWTINNLNDRGEKSINTTDTNVTLIASDASEYLKIGSDGLEVSCDAPWLETATSTVQVNEGSWYFEVTIVTGGFMQIGWGTGQSKFCHEKGYGVGDDQFGQSYDGCRQVVWHSGKQVRLENDENDDPFQVSQPRGFAPEGEGPIASWKPGDVVGSLIDIETQEIVFSLNGVDIVQEPYKEVFEEAKDGFIAAVSLISFEHCKINFGRDPFKHPPEGRPFKPLNDHSVTPSPQD